jgi:cytochrome c peroxidase
MRGTLLTAGALIGALAAPPAAAAGVSGAAALGLPTAEPSADALHAQRVALGRKLFMDRRLSRNDTMSCGMCHVPEQGFAAIEMAKAVGIEGRSLRRNAPTVLNVAFHRSLFHDGREAWLEAQVWGPLLAADEMGNGTREAVVARIAALPDYADLFQRAFPRQGLAAETVAAALADYQRTLVSGGSRFDRWFYGGESGALTAEEQRGFALFAGGAHCVSCHTFGRYHALFTDHSFHNTGVGWARATRQGQVAVPLAPGVGTRVSMQALAELFGAEPADQGRFEVTGRKTDRFAYRTPSLRNVALTPPYMHDGSLPTLEAVVDFYDRGGIDNPGKDPLVYALQLDAAEKRALVAFLRALTGANVEQLAAQARAAASTPALR